MKRDLIAVIWSLLVTGAISKWAFHVGTDNGIRLIVEALDKNRVESVRMYLPEKHDADNKSELSSSESAAQRKISKAPTESLTHQSM